MPKSVNQLVSAPKQNGGARPGAGRPKGSRTKQHNVRLPKELRQAAIEGAARALLSGEPTPLEVMERYMIGDPTVTRERFEGACALAPYRFPKLSAVAVAAAGAKTLEDLLREADEIRRGKVLTIEGPSGRQPLGRQRQTIEIATDDCASVTFPASGATTGQHGDTRSRLLAMREEASRMAAGGNEEATALLARIDTLIAKGTP